MTNNSNFNPLEWAKKENAPQKSAVNNQTPAAATGDWVAIDDYAHFLEVKIRIIRSGICITDDYNDWFRVLMAIANTYGESGRKDAEELSAMSTKFNQTEFDKKYDNCLGNSHNSITIGTFYQMAKDAGFATLANMILAGKVLKETDAVSFEGNKETLEAFIPAKKANLIDANCQALQAGYDY